MSMTENKESSKLSHLWFFLIQKTIDNQYQLCEKGKPDVQGLSDRKVYFFFLYKRAFVEKQPKRHLWNQFFHLISE